MQYRPGWLTALILLVGCRGTEYRLDAQKYTCASCLVELEHVVRLGEDAGPSSPTSRSQVVRGVDGVYYVTHTYQPGSISVFGADGRLVRTIGTPGSGPGEIRTTSAIALAGDSIFIADAAGQRISVFTTEGVFVRGFAFPYTVGRLAVSGGRIIARVLGTSVSATRPVIVVADASGGTMVELAEQPRRTANNANFAVAGDGEIWVSHFGEYRVEKYGLDGIRTAELNREVPWFRPMNILTALDARGGDARVAALQDVHPSEAGIWTLVGIAQTMPDSLKGRSRAGERRPVGPALTNERTDFVLELLNSRSGDAITGGYIAEYLLGGFLDSSHMYSYHETEEGLVVLDVLKVIVNSLD